MCTCERREKGYKGMMQRQVKIRKMTFVHNEYTYIKNKVRFNIFSFYLAILLSFCIVMFWLAQQNIRLKCMYRRYRLQNAGHLKDKGLVGDSLPTVFYACLLKGQNGHFNRNMNEWCWHGWKIHSSKVMEKLL